MKIYELKPSQQRAYVPDWHFDPATAGQLKVLNFFGIDISRPLTKGICSGIIGRLFSDPANKHLWNAYVYSTGDEDRTSSDLRPHDKAVLARIEIPTEWKPIRGPSITSKARSAFEQLIEEILKDGSPFEDPLPKVIIPGTAFCFTAKFQFGSREKCETAVISRGGTATDNITNKTDILVIGNTPNPNWSHGSFGNKILHAMTLRFQHRKPLIIPELYWRALLEESDEKSG
jgi:hypothetical protein